MKTVLIAIQFFCAALVCLGNAGVFRGGGHAPVLEKSSDVQMVEEEIIMIPRRGDYPVDTSCRNLDKMEFHCRFILRNLSDKTVTLPVGFPVSIDAVFFRDPGKINQSQLISSFGFVAGTKDKIYPVRFVPWDKQRRFSNIFLWEMTFEPGETVELFVNYTVGGYLGLGMTSRSKKGHDSDYRQQYLAMFTMGIAQMQTYITETASSWAGQVEKAVFRYYPYVFEEYLARRGAHEETMDERIARLEQLKKKGARWPNFSPDMPMVRIWNPDFGQWRQVQENRKSDCYVELVFQPFDPAEIKRIDIGYIFVSIPVNAEEFELCCRTLKKSMEKQLISREKYEDEKMDFYEKYWKNKKYYSYSPAIRKNVADVVLEFYGIPRNNPAIADFLADQVWYPVKEPRPIDEDYKKMLLKISTDPAAAKEVSGA